MQSSKQIVSRTVKREYYITGIYWSSIELLHVVLMRGQIQSSINAVRAQASLHGFSSTTFSRMLASFPKKCRSHEDYMIILTTGGLHQKLGALLENAQKNFMFTIPNHIHLHEPKMPCHNELLSQSGAA